MAQDPRKSNFVLQKASTEVRAFPTVGLTSPAEGSMDPEDVETSENPEASAKFAKLNSQGLNPLKPVIIANTEFVPVGDGTSPDSTGLKVQIGENNLLSVNSVTKLFEIHRQIRLATINSAESLLKRIKGFEINDILDAIGKKLDNSLEDLIRDDLSETVDAVIESMGNRMSGFGAPKKKDKKKPTSNQAKKENKKKGSNTCRS